VPLLSNDRSKPSCACETWASSSRTLKWTRSLSAREVEVLRLIAAGNSNKLIADQVSLSEDTIKGQLPVR
jgi:DNA-binding NarL/FixJ family response regulator